MPAPGTEAAKREKREAAEAAAALAGEAVRRVVNSRAPLIYVSGDRLL